MWIKELKSTINIVQWLARGLHLVSAREMVMMLMMTNERGGEIFTAVSGMWRLVIIIILLRRPYGVEAWYGA